MVPGRPKRTPRAQMDPKGSPKGVQGEPERPKKDPSGCPRGDQNDIDWISQLLKHHRFVKLKRALVIWLSLRGLHVGSCWATLGSCWFILDQDGVMNDHGGIIMSHLGASLESMGLMEGSWGHHGGVHGFTIASNFERPEKWGVPEKVGRGKPLPWEEGFWIGFFGLNALLHILTGYGLADRSCETHVFEITYCNNNFSLYTSILSNVSQNVPQIIFR